MSGVEARRRPAGDWRLRPILLTVPLVVSLLALYVFDRHSGGVSLLTLSNLVGPTADGLLDGRGLTVCTEEIGTPGNPICFHAARMPLPSMFVAAAVAAFGDHFFAVAILKVCLFLLPLLGAFVLVWRAMPREGPRRWLMAVLLLAPFGMTALLADVVNLQVEEGYAYSFLALAVAILFFASREGTPGAGFAMIFLFCLSVDAIYLAKSSLGPVAGVLGVAFLSGRLSRRWRLLSLLLLAMAPLGWTVHQHHASGRYSLGTSLDGLNLHKGNNAGFLERYPPAPGVTLDWFDRELNEGTSFRDEWAFNDFHQHAAIVYLHDHPARSLQGELAKLSVIFLSVRKLGSSDSHGLLRTVEVVGMVAFRLLLWTAIAAACLGVGRQRAWARDAATFLALVGACALPYLLGFAYTRHVSVLIYPSVLMCCVVLSRDVTAPAGIEAVH